MTYIMTNCNFVKKELVVGTEPPVFRAFDLVTLIGMTGIICMTPLYFELVAELLRSMPLGLWALMAGIIWIAKQNGSVPFALCSTAVARKLEAATNNLTRSAYCAAWPTAKPIACSQPGTYAGTKQKPLTRTRLRRLTTQRPSFVGSPPGAVKLIILFAIQLTAARTPGSLPRESDARSTWRNSRRSYSCCSCISSSCLLELRTLESLKQVCLEQRTLRTVYLEQRMLESLDTVCLEQRTPALTVLVLLTTRSPAPAGIPPAMGPGS